METFYNMQKEPPIPTEVVIKEEISIHEDLDNQKDSDEVFCTVYEDSCLMTNTSESSYISKYRYIQPRSNINGIKKVIHSKKQKVKQTAVRTRKKTKSVTFICDECNKEFPSWWLRRKHWIETEHKEFEICTACSKPYFFLQKHIYIKHSETLFTCSKCGKVFTSQTDVDNHLSVHSHNKNVYCFVCNKHFDELEALKKHVKKHFNLSLLVCDVCELEFIDESLLKEHKQRFHFTCPVCNNMFQSLGHLYQHHMRVHQNMVSFCESCDKCFKSKAKLKEHIKREHLKQLSFSCSECGIKFVSEPKLKDHTLVVHCQTEFECDICTKKFSYRGSLISHMKIHSGLRKIEFKCEFCNATYDQKIKLQSHLCGCSLKGFSCKQCATNFSCRTKYNEHIEEHKEKNIIFTCDYCSYSHENDKIVKHHMSNNHPSEYLEKSKDAVNCQICGHLCSSKHQLCRHQRIKHGLFRKKPRKKI